MRLLLLLQLFFVAVTACVSGSLLICYPDGSLLQLSVSLLTETPFRSFLVPGIFLAVVVGGTNLVAAVFHAMRHKRAYSWALASSVVLTGWIFAQMLLINTLHWLQFVYLFIAVMMLLLSWQLKGKWAV